ncbi:steroidogenic acute regulatory protein-like [Culicoides brevitarsis]|uniref:steroidogenic acute regulatory protein-like n=1 Tax=Culicoides brevitarsis TaxID=469753 RepID=UPI00307CB1F5
MSATLYPGRGRGLPNNPYVEFPPTPQSRGFPPPHMSDDFISGFMEDGRMSVVRRFFCLFVTFDLVFITLLWLISIMITGDNIRNAFENQIVHYSIYTSLFDIVMAAVCRFTVLLLFYALIYMNHWIIIALSTSGSCAFLISKVFVYDWTKNQEPVFQVLLVLVSFILAWGEAWFLDCRVIPQENYARTYWPGNPSINQQASMLNPFLQTLTNSLHPESVANFYSPFESIHNSDDEDDKEEEYKEMGVECVKKAYNLLEESTEWKVEKVTNKGDTIKSTHKDRVGKIFKLTGTVNYPAKLLLKELFYNIEHVPTWNPTLLESKIVRKIDNHTDISYQATTASGGGMVKSRDFINLRCWQLFQDGKILENYDVDTDTLCRLETEEEKLERTAPQKLATSLKLESEHLRPDRDAFVTLSKSLGAKNFGFDSEGFADASNEIPNAPQSDDEDSWQEKVYVSAAVSIDYPSVAMNTKYIRAQNIISCWAFREIRNKPNTCIFEWLLCLDLKGYIPKYVLDQSYTTFMQDYMTHLRKHVRELTAQGSVESIVEEQEASRS